ncbi:MAG: AMP-binding protein [Lachnospiraceae bacterium]|nr:AMP-binding protein [Lachnospiraceae bacterium]
MILNEMDVAYPFVEVKEDENGVLKDIKFKNTDNFNFAYDIVDKLAEKTPEKLAMLYVDKELNERRFSFQEMSRYSSQAANYFSFLGIKKGDKVMLVLKRHYQFWFSILALHKIGAVVIPATNLLLKSDFEYRLKAGNIDAVVCTAEGEVSKELEKACKNYKNLKVKILVGAQRNGWRSFNKEVKYFSTVFKRPTGENEIKGTDPSIMFFTSGTTAYPKITTHNFLYPLGHYVTAAYWHRVQRDGIHFAISDTGWGKALWGKIYGQWLCEAAIFTFDFDDFEPRKILKMIEKYKITTFCAPPTVYRTLVHLKLEKYDLSSLVHVTTAGEALNPEIWNKFHDATGLEIFEGFGQTETTLTIGNLVGTVPRPGSMGIPSPQYNVKIMLSNGEIAGPEEVGEIVIETKENTPCGLFVEYYGDKEKTQNTWYDGYYHTGDTAYMDEDGYFWYVGRVDDVIKSSGYRIGPFEIENEIMKLPYVLECAVTPIPDPIRGQAIKASIVLANGVEGSEKLKREVMATLKKNIASYKWPKVVDFTKNLPKTISGKIQRKEIREYDWNNDKN